MKPSDNRRYLEQAVRAALALGRVDDAPYVAIGYLRRCVAAEPRISPAEILVINDFVPDPEGETWPAVIWALADLWAQKVREQREAAQRAPPLPLFEFGAAAQGIGSGTVVCRLTRHHGG
jgi:hypothetical protein